jgi:glyoxylase-like metal-dependent hydrolase (beta-lactamase superfamily II)
MNLFKQLAGAILVGAALALPAGVPAPVSAATPQQHTQAPGWYRMMLGDVEITALLDGTHPFPVDEVMTHATKAELAALLAKSDVGQPVEGSINAFLVNTGQRLILVDSGAGVLYGDCCGHLLANLRAAGYLPEQVDDVFLTHLHRDHVGGVAAGRGMAFPNATIHVSKADADYWTSREAQKSAPQFLSSMFDGAIDSLAPYVAAHRVRTFDGETQLLPGIRAIPVAGHTPGHTAYRIESRGLTLLAWGDVVHVAPIQFPRPGVRLKYDSDEDAAESQRLALYAEAARAGWWIAAAHIAFPGLGHILSRDGQYDWAPAQYTTWVGTVPAAR